MTRSNVTHKGMNPYNKIAIVGIARSGIAAATKLNALGKSIFLSDSKPETEFKNAEQIKALGGVEFGGHSERLLKADLLIVSPGIPLNTPILQKAREKGITLWSEIELGYHLTHPETKIIAVTGSNGKSTTASLIAHLLKESGFDTILAGNIGDAYCSFDIEKKHDFIVLEVSSFQLDLIEAFRPNVAVIMNITPDHLDRYNSPAHYALSKFNIFRNQTGSDYQIVKYDDQISGDLYYSPEVKKALKKRLQLVAYEGLNNLRTFGCGNIDIPKDVLKTAKLNKMINVPTAVCLSGTIFAYDPNHNDYKPIVEDVTKLPLKGPHNLQNIMAALLAVKPFMSLRNVTAKIATFKPLEHRLEPVVIYNGIEIINDSKATNTDSVRFALQSFDQPIHLILGGYDKGEDMSVLREYMPGKVKKLYLIGKTAKNLAKVFSMGTDQSHNSPVETGKTDNSPFLRKGGTSCYAPEGGKGLKDTVNNSETNPEPVFPTYEIFTDFTAAITAAIHNATSGEVVLLSPAHASFDWFTNFEERGREFKRIVNEIICHKVYV